MPAQPPSIRGSLRKLLPHLLQAQEQTLNEADTLQRVVKVLEEALGYDGMTEISGETVVKRKFVDLAVKTEGTVRFLVEVKAAGTALRDRHTDQARSYAAEGNMPWVVLTNGVAWNLYHLTFEEGIEADLVFAIDLAKDPFDQAADQLAILHRESIRKGLHEELWKMKSALSPQSIGRALFNESVIKMIRREIRRSEGITIDQEHLASALKELFTVDAREQMGPIKIRRKRRKRLPGEETAAVQEAAGLESGTSGTLQVAQPGQAGGKEPDRAKTK
jgi:predicted type IV restriction endonuclease